MKHSIAPWVPAVFCAFLSLIALVGSIGESGGWWRPAFFAFLPMCFFFVGGAILDTQRQVRELQQRLIVLDQKIVPERRA